jgi:hypothetical protein
VTLERTMSLPGLQSVVASIDPSVDLVLAEAFDDAGSPAVELSPPGGPALTTSRGDLLAVVASDDIVGSFATFGPGATGGLADLVEERLLTTRPELELQLAVDDKPVETQGFVKEMMASLSKSVRRHIRRRSDE